MSKQLSPNRLYFGDCLEIMAEYIPDASVDLIYLDPPFNSKRIYNAFIGGAQWVAFDDTWRWHEAIDDFHAVAGDGRHAQGRSQCWKISRQMARHSILYN